MTTLNKQFKFLISQCMLADRYRFTKKIQALSNATEQDDKTAQQLINLNEQVTKSISLATARELNKPTPEFPKNLPINEKI